MKTNLAGITPENFKRLLPEFRRAHERLYPPQKTYDGHERERRFGGGRRGNLHSAKKKLLFALLARERPPQVMLQKRFSIAQSRVSYWEDRLAPVVDEIISDN